MLVGLVFFSEEAAKRRDVVRVLSFKTQPPLFCHRFVQLRQKKDQAVLIFQFQRDLSKAVARPLSSGDPPLFLDGSELYQVGESSVIIELGPFNKLFKIMTMFDIGM